MSDPNAKVDPAAVPAWSLEAARALAESSDRRLEIPVRQAFVRRTDPSMSPPLARLVGRGGRGGAVPLKLYLALIWRCSAPPFTTAILARQWATLLGLDDPNTLGARRVTNALNILEREKLVSLERRRGDSTVITLLNETGRPPGAPYTLPSTAAALARNEEQKKANRYFKIPLDLWTGGEVQAMSAPALAMLLVLLDGRNKDGRRTWWSTERFPALFDLSTAIRTKGTAELVARGLLDVRKELIADNPAFTFTRDRVRNTYELRGNARPMEVRKKAEAELTAKAARLLQPSQTR